MYELTLSTFHHFLLLVPLPLSPQPPPSPPCLSDEQPCDLSHMSLQPDRATFSPGQTEECSICCLGFTHRVVLICEHCFCPECWERCVCLSYLCVWFVCIAVCVSVCLCVCLYPHACQFICPLPLGCGHNKCREFRHMTCLPPLCPTALCSYPGT